MYHRALYAGVSGLREPPMASCEDDVDYEEVPVMSRASLSVEPRDASGKSPVARRMRKTGRVPGVLYGATMAVSFSVDKLEMAAVLRKGATIIDVELDGKKHISVLKDKQVHPVRGDLVHIDLQEVRMDQMVKTVTSITIEGECRGVKEGGVLTQGARELTIESTPTNIPDTITIDVTEIGLGDTLILRDLPAPDNVVYVDDPGMMIVAVSVPRGIKAGSREDSSAEAGEAAEGGDTAAE